MSFLTRPEDSGKIFAEVKTRQEEGRNEVKYFDLRSPGDQAEVVFLDGDLNQDGFPACPTLYQHLHFEGKKPSTYTCTKDSGDCPLCDEGISKAFVGLFTVLNLSGTKGKDGKIYHKNTRQLFAAKQSVLSKLAKLATNRGGLKGWKCTIQRDDDAKAPRTGNIFDFTKNIGEAGLAKIEASLPGQSVPLVYADVILQLSPDELRAKGFGIKKDAGPKKEDPDMMSLQKDLANLDKVPASAADDDLVF